MKKLVVGEFLTLDGVMQAPVYPWEDTEGGFKYGGWQMPYFDAEKGKIIGELIVAADALLLGRATYQIFAAYWPNAPEDDPIGIGDKLNNIPKYVVSRTLDKVEWNNSTLIKKNVEVEVAKLKQQPGSGFLYVTGSGKRLFVSGVGPMYLKLVDSKTTGSGVVILTYRPADNKMKGEK